MERTHNPFATLVALMLGTVFFLGIGYLAYTMVATGRLQLPPAQLLVNGQPQQPAAPRPPLAVPQLQPRLSAPASAPQSAPQAQPQQPAAPPAQPQAQPEPTPWQAPGVASPGGEPMSPEYQQNLQDQKRTNADGAICAPRSGCTKPGSGGDLAWPNGRP